MIESQMIIHCHVKKCDWQDFIKSDKFLSMKSFLFPYCSTIQRVWIHIKLEKEYVNQFLPFIPSCAS